MPKSSTTTSSDPLPVIRQIEGKQLQRALSVDLTTLDKEARTVEVAVSSEYPVRRWFGMEVLDHSPESVDLTRLRNGAPLLLQHNGWSGQIGVVDEAWLDSDRKLRARVRFSRSERAEEIWQDVVDGIRRNISVGYIPIEMVLERQADGVDHYRVTRWEPYEVSSVSVPADPTVGVGRSNDAATNTITIRGAVMPKENTDGQTRDVQAPNTPDAIQLERQRVADITVLCDRFNQRDLAMDAVQKGHTVDQVRALILERQAPTNPKSTTTTAPKAGARDLPNFQQDITARGLGLSDKDIADYSLMRAINAAADNNWEKAGLERDVSLALADTLKTEARGFYVPHDLLMRGLSKGTTGKGGELVATELLLDQFVDILRNKTVMAKLGMRMLPGLVGDLDIPKKVNGTSFYWLGEGQDVPDGDFDLTTLPLSPKTIAGAIPVTRRLRKQSARSIESLIIEDLVEGLGVAIDLAILRGTGQDNQPVGLLNQAGIPAIEFDGPGITFGKAVDMRTRVANANAATGALAYLASVSQAGLAQQTEKFAGTGKLIWEDGKVNGYRAEDTNQMPDDTWLFGDFSQVLMGLWGVMDLKVDTAKLAGSDGLVLRVFQDVDTTVRRKESFCVARKAAAQG